LGSKDEFKKALLSAAIRAGYEEGMQVICIADGADWLWRMFDELFPGCRKILDYYHFEENVNAFASYVFGDTKRKDIWVDGIKNLAFKNNTNAIIAAIEAIKVNVTKRPCGVPNLLNYINTKKDYITYGNFIDDDNIIGSGAIESGNKTVIQKRLKQPGMRWSSKGAQSAATLRTKFKSNLWDIVINTIQEMKYAA
jgi:hypothetical protein